MVSDPDIYRTAKILMDRIVGCGIAHASEGRADALRDYGNDIGQAVSLLFDLFV